MRIRLSGPDSNALLLQQYAYLIRFYPNMLFKSIDIRFVNSAHPARVKPRFFSMFKVPEERRYRVYYSRYAGSGMDSVLLANLSFNAQLGFISIQTSSIEELSAGGFFNYLYWYFRSLSPKGRKKIYRRAEYRSLEVGLGYQLLQYSSEFRERTQIENWQSTAGYQSFFRNYRNLPGTPAILLNYIQDLPVYMTNGFK